jgi:hypothetical protein
VCFKDQDSLDEWCESVARQQQWQDASTRKAQQAALQSRVLETDAGDKIESTVSTMVKQPYDALEETDGFHVKRPEVATPHMTLGDLKMDPSQRTLAQHIDPPHYQGYLGELQWLEAMQYLPTFSDPKCFLAALEMQIRKYMDRMGGKDDDTQEELKSLWYHKFKAAYMKNDCKPIRVSQIEEILSGDTVVCNAVPT